MTLAGVPGDFRCVVQNSRGHYPTCILTLPLLVFRINVRVFLLHLHLLLLGVFLSPCCSPLPSPFPPCSPFPSWSPARNINHYSPTRECFGIGGCLLGKGVTFFSGHCVSCNQFREVVLHGDAHLITSSSLSRASNLVFREASLRFHSSLASRKSRWAMSKFCDASLYFSSQSTLGLSFFAGPGPFDPFRLVLGSLLLHDMIINKK